MGATKCPCDMFLPHNQACICPWRPAACRAPHSQSQEASSFTIQHSSDCRARDHPVANLCVPCNESSVTAHHHQPSAHGPVHLVQQPHVTARYPLVPNSTTFPRLLHVQLRTVAAAPAAAAGMKKICSGASHGLRIPPCHKS